MDGFNVNLYLECTNLTRCEYDQQYQLVCYIKNIANIYYEIDRTPILLGNQNITFKKPFILYYSFSKQQSIKFELLNLDNDENESNMIGQCQSSLTQIIQQDQQFNLVDLNGKNNGTLMIKCEKSKQLSQQIIIDLKVNALPKIGWWEKPSVYFRLMSKDDTQLIYQSDIQYQTQYPSWKSIKISFEQLCSKDPFKIIICQVYQFPMHKFLGSFEFSVLQVNDGQKRKFDLLDSKRKQIATAVFSRFIFDPSFLFFDYLKSGIELSVIIAIDFTYSNGDQKLKESYHAVRGKNFYREAIQQVGSILMDYNHDNCIPLFGFGGKPYMTNLKTSEVLHCFPLTGDPYNCEIDGVENMVKMYEYAIKNIKLSGPTYFNMIIQETMKVAENEKNQGGNSYYILLILTDGKCHDFTKSKASTIQASTLPMSIIIVGIGEEEEFKDMEEFIGEKGLSDEFGHQAQRNIVHFVLFKDLQSKLLEDLPRQMVEYMLFIGRKAY